jgi:hypothetical protein
LLLYGDFDSKGGEDMRQKKDRECMALHDWEKEWKGRRRERALVSKERKGLISISVVDHHMQFRVFIFYHYSESTTLHSLH